MQESWVFYTNAPPLIEGGSGNHGIAHQIIRVDPKKWAFVLSRKFRFCIRRSAVRSACEGAKLILHPDASGYGLKKIFPRISGFFDFLIFAFWIFASKEVRIKKRQWFILCGADYWFLLHVWLIQKIGIPTHIYLVDEIDASEKQNFPRWIRFWMQKTFSTVLENSKTVFAISEGFVDFLKRKHYCEAKLLPLTVSTPPGAHVFVNGISERKKKIVFIGALNRLYLDGLKDIYEEIVYFNSSHCSQHPWHLEVLSYNPPNRLVELLPHTKYLVFYQNLSFQERLSRLSQASACFLPYSFSKSDELIVSTSFSCKILEYFSASSPIVVYGPEYASISKYFLKENLPFCAFNRKELGRVLNDLDPISDPNYLEKYRSVWMRYHSAAAFKNFFDEALTNKK